MLYASDLDGHQPDSHPTLHVENHSQLTMPLAAQKEPCRPSAPDRVCSNVGLDPTLQPLTGESFPLSSNNTDEGARLDIKAQNFWDCSQRSAFFDVRVFNSFAPSNSSSSTNSTYRRHEREKRRASEQRILQVEHGTVTPLVLSSSGGWGPSAMVAFRRLAGLILKWWMGSLCHGRLQETGRPHPQVVDGIPLPWSPSGGWPASSSSGGWGPSAMVAFRRLAGLILKWWMGSLCHGRLQETGRPHPQVVDGVPLPWSPSGDWPASLPPSTDNPTAQPSVSSDARLATRLYNQESSACVDQDRHSMPLPKPSASRSTPWTSSVRRCTCLTDLISLSISFSPLLYQTFAPPIIIIYMYYIYIIIMYLI